MRTLTVTKQWQTEVTIEVADDATSEEIWVITEDVANDPSTATWEGTQVCDDDEDGDEIAYRYV